ncbi:NupC/NupG family nucleoside CNT transporter [Clostridium perfringens]|uniref:NupC/NupG family nucleoside CNT transporter n=1 Tax=Clostridium perfringens TaxID=1502 RepID=UPI001E3C7A60|nr:nucleoside transporter C-terminal domain-containing protein [Clostridium perfringens]WVL78335.1 nucleoside transporter C-terminal domain-containing protein [Clostridium perfringens]
MINVFLAILALLALVGVAFALSDNKKRVNWKTVGAGLIGQFVIVLFALKVPIGQIILEKLAFGFQKVIDFGIEGITFVFGSLATGPMIFAVSVLGMIVFTSALISVLYFLKVIPFIVNTLGGLIAKFLSCSKVEAMSSVANSFLGGNEASLTIKPYLPKLTKSEFFCCMAGGFSSASAGILGGYAAMGMDMKYLLLAVFTVPFACLMFSKILVPETEESQVKDARAIHSTDSNIFEAIANGSQTGGQLAIAVAASLIAFVGVVALINGFLGIFGTSLAELLSWIFSPIGFLFGIPQGELSTFGQIVGTKTAVNEFVAFSQLSESLKVLSPRTIAILTVILTNFANFSVIAIQTAGVQALCPSRTSEMSKIGLKCLLCGTLATLSTGAMVAMVL